MDKLENNNLIFRFGSRSQRKTASGRFFSGFDKISKFSYYFLCFRQYIWKFLALFGGEFGENKVDITESFAQKRVIGAKTKAMKLRGL